MTTTHNGDFNLNGGLTLVPMHGFESLAEALREPLAEKGSPPDIANPFIGRRSNGEPHLRLKKEHVGGHDCVVLTAGPGTDSMLINLLFLVGYLAGRRASRISIITSYFPLSRSDKDEKNDEFAMPRFLIRMLEAQADGKLDRIIAVDLHAPQVVMSAFPGRITEIHMMRHVLRRAVQDALKVHDKIVVHFPDKGASSRYENDVAAIADELKVTLPTTFGDKYRRDSRTVEVKAIYRDTDQLPGALVLSVDDEGATFSTNLATARMVREKHQIYDYWSVMVHGVFCADAATNLACIDSPISRAYITDTIPPDKRPELQPFINSGFLQVVSWLDDMANVIHFHHWNEEIREQR